MAAMYQHICAKSQCGKSHPHHYEESLLPSNTVQLILVVQIQPEPHTVLMPWVVALCGALMMYATLQPSMMNSTCYSKHYCYSNTTVIQNNVGCHRSCTAMATHRPRLRIHAELMVVACPLHSAAAAADVQASRGRHPKSCGVALTSVEKRFSATVVM